MDKLIEFIIIFVVVYLTYLFFVILRKKQMKKFKNNTNYRYLVKIYKLDEQKLDIKKIAHIIALTNAFIIALTYTIVIFFDGFIKRIILATCIFILLDLIVYHIVGKILKGRE